MKVRIDEGEGGKKINLIDGGRMKIEREWNKGRKIG